MALFQRAAGPGLVVGWCVAALSSATTPSTRQSRPADVSVFHPVDSPASDRGGTGDLACLGAEASLRISRGLPHVEVTLGAVPAYRGSFLLDYATTFSTIDLATFSLPGPAATRCERASATLGERCPLGAVSFIGSSISGEVPFVTAHHGQRGSVPQAGILGTDLTSRTAIAIDYARSKLRRAEKRTFCTEADLARAGLSALSSAGFFADDASKLRPLADVVTGAARDTSVANVPTVPLRVAGIDAHAQLDTGFDDALVPLSVNVNEALFASVMAKRPGALVRTPDKDLTLSTCSGESEPVEAYTLAAGAAVDFVGELGRIVKSFSTATLFLKRTPESARKCGGIGTWTVPAAQVAASFLVAFGLVVFDPFGSRIWVK
jgi:hypothetical protein